MEAHLRNIPLFFYKFWTLDSGLRAKYKRKDLQVAVVGPATEVNLKPKTVLCYATSHADCLMCIGQALSW